jgi:SAM-dependent methyltransferase
LYKNDADYIGDLDKSKDYMYLIQWNHLTAAKVIAGQPKIKNLLDIGTFNGFFVKYMREKGYEAYGVDFNEDAIRNGIDNYNLQGYLSIDAKNFEVEKYDCISAFEVIEHLEDPNQFLSDISSLLTKDGLLAISCPNNKMLWRVQVDYPPHHLSRFSPVSLRLMLEKHGFEILQHKEQMSFVDLSRNFIGSLLRDSKSDSLKGGNHKKLFFIDPLRFVLNKGRVFSYLLAKPIDSLLHFFGYRYVCQLIIARKVG